MSDVMTAITQAYENRIADLESKVAELELTGSRAELRSLLDACGLDFERMRERALEAERQLAESQRRHAITEHEACSRAADAEELRRQLEEARTQYDADKERGHKYRDKLMARAEAAERQLEEARGDAEFAQDQLEVAIKDRDHAERRLARAEEAGHQLAKARKALAEDQTAILREQARAEAAERQLAEAHSWIAEATKVITDLSGGGSENFVQRGDEYRADLPFCASRIRERFDAGHRRLLEVVGARRKAEVQARAALERDRTEVATTLSAIRRVMSGRQWLREPGKGSYAYDDDRWRDEFGGALDELEEAIKPLAKIARDWSNCPTDPTEIARARAHEDHPTPAEGQCVSTASVEAPGPAGSYAAAAEVWSG